MPQPVEPTEQAMMDAPAAPAGAPAPPVDDDLDIEALLGEVDAFARPETKPDPLAEMRAVLDRKSKAVELEGEAGADEYAKRLEGLERKLDELTQANERLRLAGERRGIDASVDEAVLSEMQKVGMDPTSSIGKAFGRFVRQSTIYTIAEHQQNTGAQSVDPASVKATARNNARVFVRMAQELSALQAEKAKRDERRAPAGAAHPPKPDKNPGQMTDAELSEAVSKRLAYLKGA